jgi:dephospho-CoA kinase
MFHSVAVAFAGRIGAGKSSVSAALASELKSKRASFGDYIRQVAASRGLNPTRDVLQTIGAELEATDATELCKAVLGSVDWRGGESIVIDGVRHVSVLEILRELVSPLPLFFVYLDVEDSLRKTRLDHRPESAEEMSSIEAHSTEHDVIARLPEIADLRLSSDLDSVLDLVQMIKSRLVPQQMS